MYHLPEMQDPNPQILGEDAIEDAIVTAYAMTLVSRQLPDPQRQTSDQGNQNSGAVDQQQIADCVAYSANIPPCLVDSVVELQQCITRTHQEMI